MISNLADSGLLGWYTDHGWPTLSRCRVYWSSCGVVDWDNAVYSYLYTVIPTLVLGTYYWVPREMPRTQYPCSWELRASPHIARCPCCHSRLECCYWGLPLEGLGSSLQTGAVGLLRPNCSETVLCCYLKYIKDISFKTRIFEVSLNCEMHRNCSYTFVQIFYSLILLSWFYLLH